MTSVLVYPSVQAVAEAAAARLLLATGDAVALRGRADVVLTGGTLGIAVLAGAAVSPLSRSLDWTSVHLWWGDERFVPTGDDDRNEGQAQSALLRALPLPEDNIHRVAGADQVTSAGAAADAYSAEIASHGDPQWDVALFGVGPDGHVASLFPGHEVFEQSRQQVADAGPHGASSTAAARALPVTDSPKPPPKRVTLTLATINQARQVWLLAAGASKADAVSGALRHGSDLPAAYVHGTERTLWLLDAAASTRI